MKKELKDKFPAWVNDTKTDYATCLSNDFDSLLSCKLLKKIKGYNIGYFYSFSNLYKTKNALPDIIGVDISFTEGRCWDNHVTMANQNDYVNLMSANPNSILSISRSNYNKKYAGSTALLIYSYYAIPLPDTLEGKRILLAIDSTFKGYYNCGGRYSYITKNWLRQLQLDDLIEVLEKSQAKDFYEVINKYKLDGHIKVYNGKLKTNINLPELEGFFNVELSLPEQQFELLRQYQYKTADLSQGESINKSTKIISLAFTYQNKLAYTVAQED